MFLVFLTVVSTVGIISAVVYRYLELKARAPIQNEDVLALQAEMTRLRKRLEAVEAIVAADAPESPAVPLPDEPELPEHDLPKKRTSSRA